MARRGTTSTSSSCLTLILSHFIVTALFFHLGSLFHASIFLRCYSYHSNVKNSTTCLNEQQKPTSAVLRRDIEDLPREDHHHHHHHHHHYDRENLLSHAVRIPRLEFAAHFNLGIPLEEESSGTTGNQDVLLLRLPPFFQNSNNNKTAENSSSSSSSKSRQQPGRIPLQSSADEALSSCHIVKLVLMRPSRSSNIHRATGDATAGTNSEAELLSGDDEAAACLAIAVGPHDSFHMHTWARRQQRPVAGESNDNRHNKNMKRHNNLQPVGQLVGNPPPRPPVPPNNKNENNDATTGAGAAGAGERFQQQQQQQPPSVAQTAESFHLLHSYLNVRPRVLKELQAILSQMTAASRGRGGGGGGAKNKGNASPPPSTTILIMVANPDNVDLFVNYCCAARAVGMDLHHLLLFATDEATHKMVQQQQDGLLGGITSFYNVDLFSAIASMDANDSAATSSLSSLAQIYAVELIVSLGYNVLYQDVDIVPYRADYVSYLQEKIQKDDDEDAAFDLYFQYDGHDLAGSSSVFESPYSVANSGFYYVQSNVRTRYLFSKLVALGMDFLILDTNNRQHQEATAMVQPLQLLLSEQASLFGLRVKTLQGGKRNHQQQEQPNDNDVDNEAWLFPNGYHFHTKPEYMARLFQKEIHPFLFHMNAWGNNYNKTTKVKFLQQMGDWHVKDDDCLVSLQQQQQQQQRADSAQNNGCCILNPVPKCHYRDMPSPHPCRDSPAFQERPDAKSLW
jgi:Nucleotide-diphospho-sugar transferase